MCAELSELNLDALYSGGGETLVLRPSEMPDAFCDSAACDVSLQPPLGAADQGVAVTDWGEAAKKLSGGGGGSL